MMVAVLRLVASRIRPGRSLALLQLHHLAAEALADHLEVRREDVDADRVDLARDHVGLDLAIAVVVPQQHDHRRLRLARGGQLLDGELQAAIADQAHHRPLRRRQLRADRRRQRIAERAVAGRRAEPGARRRRGIGDHAGIDRLRRIADQHRARQAVAHRLHQMQAGAIDAAEIAEHGIARRARARRAVALRRAQQRHQGRRRFRGIGDDRQVGLARAHDLLRVDVDADASCR